MKMYISRTSDVLVFSDDMVESDLQDLTGEIIYQDDEGETYYEIDPQKQENFIAWCKQEKLKPSSMHTLAKYMELEAE